MTVSTRDDADVIRNIIRDETKQRTLQFNNFNWVVFLAHPEDFQITKDGLLCFGVAIDFDTQEITLILPVKLTL